MKFDAVLAEFDPWQMAGMLLLENSLDPSNAPTFFFFFPVSGLAMERATYTTKSFIIALALVKRRLTADQAAETAHVEVNSQIERWGEVEDCKYLSLSTCWHSFLFFRSQYFFVISDFNICRCKALTC